MSPLDVIVVLMIGYGFLWGARRGMGVVLIEYAQVILAIAVAAMLYQPMGNLWRGPIGGSAALANVSAFVAIFLAADMLIMVISMHWLHHRAKHLLGNHPKWLSRIVGSILNGIKLTAFAAAVVILLEALPLSGSDQRTLFHSPIARAMLNKTNPVSQLLHGILGPNLTHGLGLLVVATDPEDNKVVNLNFRTKGVVVKEEEQEMLAYVNIERTRQGLSQLTMNEEAQVVARRYAQDLFEGGYFSHRGRDGSSPFDRLSRGDVPFGYAGENLALAPDVQAAHLGLMNSPPHRANILSKHYATVGIGIIKSPDHGVMVVQEFTD